jgi:hypothetical protein
MPLSGPVPSIHPVVYTVCPIVIDYKYNMTYYLDMYRRRKERERERERVCQERYSIIHCPGL